MNMITQLAAKAAETAITTAAENAAKKPGVGLFLDTLPIMAGGMLGIFAVTGVIIGAIYLLGMAKKEDK